MPNMNHFKDPAIYALHAGDGVYRYIGRTSVNSQNRLWEHIYRARSGHPSSVYVWMREIGIENVCVVDLVKLEPGIDAKLLEAQIIRELIECGYPLTNVLGRDGVPDSVPIELRSRMNADKKGKPSWIAGKSGEEAGWNSERRARQSHIMRQRNVAA